MHIICRLRKKAFTHLVSTSIYLGRKKVTHHAIHTIDAIFRKKHFFRHMQKFQAISQLTGNNKIPAMFMRTEIGTHLCVCICICVCVRVSFISNEGKNFLIQQWLPYTDFIKLMHTHTHVQPTRCHAYLFASRMNLIYAKRMAPCQCRCQEIQICTFLRTFQICTNRFFIKH